VVRAVHAFQFAASLLHCVKIAAPAPLLNRPFQAL